MNRTLKLLTLSALFLLSTFEQASAQQRYVDSSKLPNAQKIYKAPLQIQIVPDAPRITSVPAAPDPNKVLVIQMPPQQNPSTEVMYVSAPGSGGVSGLPPGMAAVNLSQPPTSRFGTNIPQSGTFAPANLLPGQSSNGLANQKFVTGRLNGPGATAVKQPISRTPLARKAVADQTARVYDPPGYGQGGAGTSQVKAVGEVSAVRLPRRTLLDKAK